MSLILRLKHALVRTPFERPAKQLRRVAKYVRRLRTPGLAEVLKEDERIEAIMRLSIQPSWNCVDVGCHIGSTLSLMTSLAYRGSHIAFEPTPTKASWLARKFPEVDVRNIALGAEPGRATFHENLTRPGFSSLALPKKASDQRSSYEVRIDTLDQALSAEYLPNLVKIDVEGAELFVLRGAAQTIRRSKPVLLFECAHDGPLKFGSTPEELFEFVTEALEYAVYLPKSHLERGEPLSAAGFAESQVYPFKAFNYVAVPAGLRR